MKTRILTMALIALLGLSQTACNALLAGATGAAAGQAIGQDTESTLIGLGAGILGNLLLESESRKYQERQQVHVAPAPAHLPAMKPDCSRLYSNEERAACRQGITDSASRAKKDRLNEAYQYGLGQ